MTAGACVNIGFVANMDKISECCAGFGFGFGLHVCNCNILHHIISGVNGVFTAPSVSYVFIVRRILFRLIDDD
jgi:hypothetical protein